MKYLFLSLFFVSLLSCSKNDDDSTTENQAPTAFNLTTPVNNATGIAHLSVLTWQTATDPNGDAVTYTVYLDKTPSPTTIFTSGLTTTSHTLTFPLESSTVYYWKVVATDAKGATTTSSVFKFTTVSGPAPKVSLPVKVTYKNAGGTVILTNTPTYDSQKRLSSVRTIDNVDVTDNRTTTHSYENGKVTSNIVYDDTAQPKQKYIYYYNTSGMQKEELYYDNVLNFNWEWYYRPDGGKERRMKRVTGEAVATWFYRFSATGNIERAVSDDAVAGAEDFEYTFGNFDNKPSARIASQYNYVIPHIIMGFPGTNLPTPNNPQTYTKKSLTTGNVVENYNIDYTYNAKNQVTLMIFKNVSNGAVKRTCTIEYQEF